MKTFTGSITQSTVDAFYLADQLLAFPEIKKKFIKKQCEERNFTLLTMVFGYGRAITDSDLRSDKMTIADYRFQWTIMTRLREYLTFNAIPASGQGANNASITINLVESWPAAGMTLLVQNGNGGWQNLVLTSNGSASGGGYNYTAKLVTGDAAATFDVSFIAEGTQVGWGWSMDAVCGDGATKIPFKSLDWYVNYTTLIKQYDVICKDGLQTALWVEGDDGTRCFQPMEEYQKFFHFLESIEYAGWYGTRTYNSSGVAIVTDATGQYLRAGDGILAQADSSTVIDYLLTDYVNSDGTDQTANLESFRQMIKTEIISWAIDNDIYSDGYELHIWAGLAAYALWQDALIQFLEQAGGCCFMDMDTGDMVSAGVHVSTYKFAGFVLHLHKNATFSKKGVNAAFYGSTTVPLEAYRFVIMPDMNCDGEPLIQAYFRGGCGVQSAYTHTVIPGTVNPIDRTSSIGASKLRGYEVVDESEFVFVLSDPSKMITFQPNTVSSS